MHGKGRGTHGKTEDHRTFVACKRTESIFGNSALFPSLGAVMPSPLRTMTFRADAQWSLDLELPQQRGVENPSISDSS